MNECSYFFRMCQCVLMVSHVGRLGSARPWGDHKDTLADSEKVDHRVFFPNVSVCPYGHPWRQTGLGPGHGPWKTIRPWPSSFFFECGPSAQPALRSRCCASRVLVTECTQTAVSRRCGSHARTATRSLAHVGVRIIALHATSCSFTSLGGSRAGPPRAAMKARQAAQQAAFCFRVMPRRRVAGVKRAAGRAADGFASSRFYYTLSIGLSTLLVQVCVLGLAWARRRLRLRRQWPAGQGGVS